MTDQTVIVGAGPAGLAVAAELGRRGVPYAILERASLVGSAWRGRYDSLRLHSARALSGLPGTPIPRRFGQWVARDDLVRYLEAYAQRFGIRPEFGVEVKRVDPIHQGWQVTTSAGERSAPAVVVATGMTRTPHRPDWPGQEDFSGSLVHAADYREPSAYRDRAVLVVGAGNSAAEIAVELAGVAASVLLSVRTPPNIVRRDTLGVPSQLVAVALSSLPEAVLNPLLRLLRLATVPDLRAFGLPAPSGGYSQFLRSQTLPILDHGFVAAVREHRIAVVPAVTGFDGGRVRLADGQTVAPDDVIAATGYRPALEGMVGHLGVLDGRGMPKAHGVQTVPGCDGLYFVGLTVQLSGLLRQIGREAKAAGRALAAARG